MKELDLDLCENNSHRVINNYFLVLYFQINGMENNFFSLGMRSSSPKEEVSWLSQILRVPLSKCKLFLHTNKVA